MENTDTQNLLSVIDSRFENIQNTVENVAEEVSLLSKVLIVGNGQPALTTRVAVVEKESSEARKESSETRREFMAFRDEMSAQRDAKDSRNWHGFLVFLSILASLVTALITALWKHS